MNAAPTTYTTVEAPGHVGDRPMLIGGALTFGDGKSGWIDTINPATEEPLGRVPKASPGDVDAAVEAARSAYPAWAAGPVKERALHLRTLADRLRDREGEIVRLEVADTGTTIGKMRRDVAVAIDTLEYYAGLGLELKGDTVPATGEHLHLSFREPYGVVGRIVAFNHPIAFLGSRMAAPLMAGNAVIMKAPEQAPLSASVLAEICSEVFPPGVVSILTGDGQTTGDSLVRHPAVKRLTLIGSIPTGMRIQRTAAEVGVKHVSLELGGKNPLIAYPDAQLDRVRDAAVNGMNFGHQGQSCGSTSRLFLHESVVDDVLEDVVHRVQDLNLGDPQDDASQMGALISAAHRDRVEGFVTRAVHEGATVLAGGERPIGPGFERGFWYRPTVMGNVTPGMELFNTEVFGPVLSVITWRDEDELFEMVNRVEYGLSASIWTQDLQTAIRASRRVEAGYVWVNGASAHYLGTDFGGKKNSGVGTEEGLAELLSYTETKTVHVMVDTQAGFPAKVSG
jgi:acyl-CoA reductase-like NAD-dependent aldehyde dehydrogenase